MVRINHTGTMGHAAGEVQAELTLKVVVQDSLITVGLGIDGGRIDMAIVEHQHGATGMLEFHATIDSQQGRSISRGQRLRVQMLAAVENLGSEDQAGLAVLNLQSRLATEQRVAVLKPIQALRLVGLSASAATGALLLVRFVLDRKSVV